MSQRGERFQFDAIIIGSGVAGLCYVLELIKLRPQAKLALLTKGKLSQANTYHAQGGIAAAHSPSDIQPHIHDTLAAGDGLCVHEAVTAILQKGPESIQYLLEKGVVFDRDEENNLARGQEAGHSERRIYHVGDQTGAAIMDALIAQLRHIRKLQFLNITLRLI